MYDFRVFPEQRLVSVRYTGEVVFEELVRVCRELSNVPDFQLNFCGVSDERLADVVMSREEVDHLAQFVQHEIGFSGRWVHLINSPSSAVSANEYGKRRAGGYVDNIFSSVEAAAEYLDIEELEKYLDW